MNRLETITQEVGKDLTGLRGKCFIHVDHANGHIDAIRLSEKGKDSSTLDNLFTALGDALTDVLREIQG
jgi:UDP-glucose 4-epimerase